MDLNTIWFLLVGVLIVGYAVLDGFDLGVGSLYYLLGKTEEEKRILIKSVGPFWDGNEVWLLTGGGALFAAFPLVYATVFSGFYLAMMLVVLGLIMRAVGIEFRNKFEGAEWRRTWDFLFFLGSFLPALLFGVAVGNVARGLPLDSSYNYTGGFFDLLNPYSLLLGLIGFSAFILQGLTYILMKTEGTLQKRAQDIFPKVWLAFVILHILGAFYTYQVAPGLFENYMRVPILLLIPLVTFTGVVLARRAVSQKMYGLGFAGSSLAVAGMILTLALGMFPNLVPAADPNLSLTIYNAASSQLTLKAMLIIALTGVPIVLFYTVYVYRVFRGKVRLNQGGY